MTGWKGMINCKGHNNGLVKASNGGAWKKYTPVISVSTYVAGSRFELDTFRIHVINVSCWANSLDCCSFRIMILYKLPSECLGIITSYLGDWQKSTRTHIKLSMSHFHRIPTFRPSISCCEYSQSGLYYCTCRYDSEFIFPSRYIFKFIDVRKKIYLLYLTVAVWL